ncbi:MAG: alpha/beta hydrolase [Melioribacteraceae bacterium]
MQFPELIYDFDYSIAQIDENISIAYTDEGNRESEFVLLCIHGLSSYIPAWSKLIPLLKDQFRCIAIDLPGYGKSSGGVHPGTMEYYADTIAKFIRKISLKNVVLTGHSMGGHISIVTALLYPGLINRLILLAPAGFETFSEEETEWIKRNNSPELYSMVSDRQIRLNYQLNFFEMPDDVEAMINDRIKMKKWKNYKDNCKVVSNSLNGLLDYPVFDKLYLITQPSLILFGKNDRLIPHPILHKNSTPEEVASLASARIPNSFLSLIDQCGHFLQFEKPASAAGEIISFMKSR